MKTPALRVIPVLTELAKRAGPGRARARIAESVLLKYLQLHVILETASLASGSSPTCQGYVYRLAILLNSTFVAYYQIMDIP